MTTPANEIAKLDRELASKGQSVLMRRGASGPTYAMRGFVRGYEIEKVVGLITTADRKVILSPTDLGEFGIPRASDDVSTGGRVGKVQEAEPIHMNDVLIRVEARIRVS